MVIIMLRPTSLTVNSASSQGCVEGKTIFSKLLVMPKDEREEKVVDKDDVLISPCMSVSNKDINTRVLLSTRKHI